MIAYQGDTIQCKVTNPRPAILKARLDTPEAVAMGNELIADTESGWTLSSVIEGGGK